MFITHPFILFRRFSARFWRHNMLAWRHNCVTKLRWYQVFTFSQTHVTWINQLQVTSSLYVISPFEFSIWSARSISNMTWSRSNNNSRVVTKANRVISLQIVFKDERSESRMLTSYKLQDRWWRHQLISLLPTSLNDSNSVDRWDSTSLMTS